MRRFALAFSGIVLTVLLLVQPQEAAATTVTATVCTVNTFPCPLINTVDSGIRTNGVGILGANRYSLLPFVFADAFATFTGNILVTDSAGVFIYMWGGGVATNLAAPAGGFYLDVGIQQTYLTAAGIGQFSEFNIGNCNAATVGTTSGVAATMGVNGSFLPVLGAGFNNCPAFAQGAGPAAVAIGNFTTLTALAQFYFDPAGGVGQSIDLPWGADYPDPGILLLPDPFNLPSGFTEQNPEPATVSLILAPLCVGLWFLRRKAKTRITV